MCSYLLMGFRFTQSIAANASQKTFVTNRVRYFGYYKEFWSLLDKR